MIAPLRRLHRRSMPVLALVLPLGLWAALDARPALPVQPGVTTGQGFDPEQANDSRPGRLVLADGSSLFVMQSAGRVELHCDGPAPALPALLVYGAISNVEPAELPGGAHLLGGLGGPAPRHYELPEALVGDDTWLLVYSLGHQELVGACPLPAPQATEGH